MLLFHAGPRFEIQFGCPSVVYVHIEEFPVWGQGGLLGLDGPMGEKEEGKKGREVEGLKKSIHMYICCCYFLLYIHGEIKFEKARKKKKKKKE